MLPGMPTRKPAAPVRRVITERRRRGWSARTAAQVAQISNTTWSGFERTGKLTDTIRQAVAEAFGWPVDWPERPTPVESGDVAAVLDELRALRAELSEHRAAVEADAGTRSTIDALVVQLAALAEQLAKRDRLLDALQARLPGPRPAGSSIQR